MQSLPVYAMDVAVVWQGWKVESSLRTRKMMLHTTLYPILTTWQACRLMSGVLFSGRAVDVLKGHEDEVRKEVCRL